MATTEKGIYYPNDGTKTADVLADLKQMAESVDEAIGKEVEENKYNDADIKKDISDIKEEQQTQNKNIEQNTTKNKEQDELISKLKSALINVETEQAKSLHIEDASTVAGKLEVEGNAEQETREGYNLLDINKGVISNDCTMTQISKSEYKITVNNNADWARIDIPISLLSTKTYRASIYTKVSNANARIEIGTYKDNTQYGSKLSNNSTDYKKQIIDNVETNINRFVIWLNPDSVSEEFEVYIKELMLYEGSEEKEYEPYGAMPSPKFPSAIKCLGSNKNIYPGWEHGTVSQETGNLQNDSKYIRSVDFIPVLPNVNYCLKAYDLENISMLNTAVRMYDANKQYLGNQHVGNIQSTEQTFTITNTNVRYIKPVHLNSTDIPDTAKVNIKLEEGTEATSYSPYGQGSTKISKINENLFDKNNYIKIYDGQVNSSGVINTSDARHKTLLIECRPNVELSAYIKNKNNSYSRLLSCFDEEPVVGETEATATSTSPNGLHITTTSNTKYLAIYLGATFDENWVSVQDIIDSVMLVKGNVSLTSKDYVEHKQSNYILNIQQEMLQGDYFVKEEDGWKEVHGWIKVVLDGVSNKVLPDATNTEGKYRYFHSISTIEIENCSKSATDKEAYCEQLKLLSGGQTYNCIEGFTVNNNSIFIYTDGDTEKNFNIKLQENNMVFYIPVVESARTKLLCTPEQSAVLDELNNLNLFEGVNNIITTENIAKLKLKYVADTKTYVDKEISDIKEQLNTINELLSTTATSSMLLENLQTDLESGVM